MVKIIEVIKYFHYKIAPLCGVIVLFSMLTGCAALVGIKEYESKGDYTKISFVTGYGADMSVTASDSLNDQRGIKPSTTLVSSKRLDN